MITLSSDFGSPYPAAMKGVICRATDARIEDIAHDFPRQDVRAAAFWLTQTLPYFPPAVHCVVVDPGVGTDRDALVIRAGEHALVGPDNGVLLPVARELAENENDAADTFEVFTWAYDDPASTTFHGRDVFAPAAAAVHDTGVDTIETRPEIEPTDDYVDLRFPAAAVEGDGATGEVLVVDDFGNAVTNIPVRYLRSGSAGWSRSTALRLQSDGPTPPSTRASDSSLLAAMGTSNSPSTAAAATKRSVSVPATQFPYHCDDV